MTSYMAPLLIAFSMAAATTGIGAKTNKVPQSPSLESCTAVYVVDAKTGKVLEDKRNNAHQELPIASLTKIFTAAAFKNTLNDLAYITLPVLDQITPGQFARYESCTAPHFPSTSKTLNIPSDQAIIALLASSHNPLAYKIGEMVGSHQNNGDFLKAVRTTLEKIGLPATDIHIVNNDPSGMIGAQSCAKTQLPPRLRGNQATPALITQTWAWLVGELGSTADNLKGQTVSFLGTQLPNTNPFKYFNFIPNVTVIGKTGALAGVSNFAGSGLGPNGSVHFTLICPNRSTRQKEGERVIWDYVLGVPQISTTTGPSLSGQ